jgi:hypothetical protein
MDILLANNEREYCHISIPLPPRLLYFNLKPPGSRQQAAGSLHTDNKTDYVLYYIK